MRRCKNLFFLLLLTAPTAHAATFLCFGDSLTHGESGGPTSAYLGPLGTYLGTIGQPATMLNHGVPGNSTADALSRIASTLAANPSEYVLLMLGTNDLTLWPRGLYGVTPDSTEANLLTIVDACLAAGRSTIIATVPPRLSGDRVDPTNSMTNQLNGIIRSIASRRGLRVADVNANVAAFANEFTYDDSIHPAAFALPLISEAFAAAITSQSLAAIDLTGPLPVDITPTPFSSGNPVNVNVQIALRDRSGVDAAGAVMQIDSVSVVPILDSSHAGDTRFIYNFPRALDLGRRVTVAMTASDLGASRRSTSLSYSFDTSPGNGTGGDLDRSGRVDGLDLAILASAFGTSAGDARFYVAADIDSNGIVDGADLAIVASRFGSRP